MIFHALLIAAPSPDRVTGPSVFPTSLVEKPGCLALNPANFSIKVSGATPKKSDVFFDVTLIASSCSFPGIVGEPDACSKSV